MDERVVRFADSVAEVGYLCFYGVSTSPMARANVDYDFVQGYKAADAPTAAMSYNEGQRRASALKTAEGAGHDRV